MHGLHYRRWCWAWLVALVLAGARADVVVLPDYPAQNPYVDTIRFVALTPIDMDFYHDGDVRDLTVLPDKNAGEYAYKLWLQEEPAPLVMLIPGLGGHWANLGPSALAETFFSNGYSVALISSTFNWDFVLHASSAIAPGYTPRDVRDVYTVLQCVLADVSNEYGAACVTQTLLCGYSLGAIHTLFIADLDARERRINFSRFVAINPPVNLVYSLRLLDFFYSTWTNWTPQELIRTKNEAVRFYQAMISEGVKLALTNIALPLTAAEAEFAIGYSFRRTLSETIKAIQKRKDFGILSSYSSSLKQRLAEKEIERFGYANYLLTFLKAAYSNEWGRIFSVTNLNLQASLPAIAATLHDNPKIMVLHNVDDFLLTSYDREWLNNVLGDKLVWFNHGGHLGNLYRPDYQACIVRALRGQKPTLATIPYSAMGQVGQVRILEQPAAKGTPAPIAMPALIVAPKAAPAPVVAPKAAPAPVVAPKAAPAPVVTPKAAPAPVVAPKAAPAPVVAPKAAPAPVVAPKTAAPTTVPADSTDEAEPPDDASLRDDVEIEYYEE